ncbi:Activator of Hsp90 ATPase 1 family protein [Neorhizobium galegae bv. officinalis]|nr:Activator of Hsp90 ATPase 1 family protein [Neorhizobium galegae bv. officinalis]
MDKKASDGRTAVEWRSERELVVTRSFNAPVRLVFDAWTKPELFKQWWAPKSSGVPLLACEMDARTGGGYSVTFGHDAENSMTFFGKYLEVSPPSRLVWTNDESEDGSVTRVTFEEEEVGRTLLVLHERYPSKEAADESCAGMAGAMPEQLGQLDELLITLGASA